MTQTFKSFRDLATAIHAQDVQKAANLRKAAALPKPKLGPKVAK